MRGRALVDPDDRFTDRPACFELPCLATPTAGRVVMFNLDG